MSKPVLVINPVTGQQSYTKHPERLIERTLAKREANYLKLLVREKAVAEQYDPRYWNGSPKPAILRSVKSDGIWRSGNNMHRPGEVRS